MSLEELAKHSYLTSDSVDNLQQSEEELLFLSYLPGNQDGAGDMLQSTNSFEVVRHGLGVPDNQITHVDLLKQTNPWRFMKQNADLVVELNVHGHNRYEAVVLERIAKYE